MSKSTSSYKYFILDCLLNQYDGSNREMENRIRDLVCYISDSSEYMQIDLYRSIVFEAAQQIRNIVEYEIPKLLCLFESLFQQAGKLLGYNMDDFNLSSVIRFFELGITTELGLFLVEFGFPTDTIRALENKYPSIGKMGALEAATFLSNNQRAMYSVMDAYEQELFKRAMQVLVKRG